MARSEAGRAVCERMEADYRDRFAAIGGGMSAWCGGVTLGVEALFGGRVGPMWQASIRIRRRPFGIGRARPVLDIDEAEAQLRVKIEDYLASRAS